MPSNICQKMVGLFASRCFLLLFFLVPSLSNSLPYLPSPFAPPPAPLCHPHESSALLHFNNSFSIFNDSYYFYDCAKFSGIANPNRTTSWDMSRDCCTWSGVTCDEVTGHVIRLDLQCSGLEGVLYSNSSLFSLGDLQSLVLSFNLFYGQVPLELSYLSNLVTLDLSWTDLKPETSSWKRIVANLTNLRELSLGGVNMSNVLPNSFLNLSTSLTSLDLSHSRLKGEFPENVFNLPNLQVLDLSYNELKGEFPENVFNLPNLQVLDLSYNENLTGSFPQYNWSSPLKVLNLSESGFLIDLPYLYKKFKYLRALSLGNCNFVGPFSNFTQILGSIFLNLQQLTDLDLSDNNFIGQIPERCSDATKDSLLCVASQNQVVGPLPLNLKSLCLRSNKLNGTIPSWLYSLPYLYRLDLYNNQFTGHINEFQYNSLVYLNLGSNRLQGFFPISIFRQVNLSFLGLGSNNLSGVVSFEQFSKLKNLGHLSLSYNSLSLDSINNTDFTLPNTLFGLYLSSCGISEFPYFLRSLENLLFLDLSNNQIEGGVPQWLWNIGKNSLYSLNISHNFLTHVDQIPWESLESIDLSSNRLQGHLPIPPPLTSFFLISNNKLVGGISSLICNLSSLGVLDLSNNSLSGDIPPCLVNSSNINLSVLDLRMNKFQGIIPPAFSKGNYLTILNLNGNQLEGSLPKSLLHCKNLEILDVGNNKMNGSFPHWLESLPELQVLILRSNRFHGPICNPKVRFPFQMLRIMDISDNEFTGHLPAKYFENFVAMVEAKTSDFRYMGGRFPGAIDSYYSVAVVMKGFYFELEKIQTMFITIDFSRNNFTGEIPKLIGKLKPLKGLNFSHNKLIGTIPTSLGNLSNLEWLDLSSNQLVGKIPWQLADLYQLEFLNLSTNRLEGPIPRGPQFNTFENDSYSGNLGLCGFPISKSCSEDPMGQPSSPTSEQEGEEEHVNGFEWKAVLMGYGSGMVIGISVGYILLTDKTIDWLVKSVRGEQWCRLVKRSKRSPR